MHVIVSGLLVVFAFCFVFVEADVLINPFFVVGVVSCPLSGAVIKPILPPTLGARGHVSRMTILAHTALSGLRGATR